MTLSGRQRSYTEPYFGINGYHSPFERIRRVSLKGESLFPYTERQETFYHHNRSGTVQVLGTQFNVRVRDGRMEVAVISGIVKISGVRDGIDSSIILRKDSSPVCKERFSGIPRTSSIFRISPDGCMENLCSTGKSFCSIQRSRVPLRYQHTRRGTPIAWWNDYRNNRQPECGGCLSLRSSGSQGAFSPWRH